MNSQLSHLMAQERMADLMRSAEQARLAKDARAIESEAGRDGSTTRGFVGLRLWGVGIPRLRARRT
jgi:hypothetical protein